jgi:acetoin utilization deacetylase AcuC-like enzyme
MVSAGFDAHEKEYAGMQRHKRRVPDHFYARFTMDVLAVLDLRPTGGG